MLKISVAMITYNGENIIEKTLKAVYGWADEIVAVDSHSSDSTPRILSRYNARVYAEDWKGEGLQYKSAVSKCKNEWVLILDQDEVITEELKSAIAAELSNPGFAVYELKFKNICFGKPMRFGQAMYKRVLFKKGIETFDAVAWHSQLSTSLKAGRINGHIEHYNYNSIEEYFSKFNRYTSDLASEMHRTGKTAGLSRIFLNPVFNFLKDYLFRLNFLNGYEGLLLSLFSSWYTMIKYAKLYEVARKHGKK